MDEIGRKTLPHDPPLWVPSDAVFFVTICCQPRGQDHLCSAAVAEILFGAARHYCQQQKWFMHLLLLMPDHVHFLVTPGREHALAAAVKSWKSYCAKQAGVSWQRDFFEHRLRSEESLDEKANYILRNPVRAGLMREEEIWPFVFRGG